MLKRCLASSACARSAPMPLIRTIRPRMFAAKPLPPLPTADDVTGDFPVVVVVDSGIADQHSRPWRAGSWAATPRSRPRTRNTDHGTFVAGLICWGSQLNPTIAGLDNSPCGVFDLQVIPNDDPAKGRYAPAVGIRVPSVAGRSAEAAREQIQGLESLARHGRGLLARRVFRARRRSRQPAGEVSSLLRHQRRELRHAAAAGLSRAPASS